MKFVLFYFLGIFRWSEKLSDGSYNYIKHICPYHLWNQHIFQFQILKTAPSILYNHENCSK